MLCFSRLWIIALLCQSRGRNSHLAHYRNNSSGAYCCRRRFISRIQSELRHTRCLYCCCSGYDRLWCCHRYSFEIRGVEKMSKMQSDSKYRSDCPIAKTLDLLGDKSTLLILRDVLIFSATTYTHFSQSSENIPTNLLSQRLKKLVDEGLLEKKAYQDNPIRFKYLPTEKCKSVRPIIVAMKEFGDLNF